MSLGSFSYQNYIGFIKNSTKKTGHGSVANGVF